MNSGDDISYHFDVILDVPSSRRDLIDHNIDSYVKSYSNKFSEIILETQICLRERFHDFDDTCPLRQLCVLFDIKLWPKSTDKTWGFDILGDALEYYVQNNFITEEEAQRCKQQWPLFRTRIHKHRRDSVMTCTSTC